MTMGRALLRIVSGLTIALRLTAPLPARAVEVDAEPNDTRLRPHVAALASPEYQGRRGAGGIKAAEYIVGHFRKLGLEPAFDGKFSQEIPAREGNVPMGRNVGAILRGSDPKLRDEWVIVSAHFDHLGQRGEVVYPGADDNASGVAMLLEAARSFVEAKIPPKRSVMFLSFDLEEIGLFGSRYFVEHSPVPLSKIALFMTADMIGRALGGVCESYVFVMGSEHAPGLRPWLDQAAKDQPLKVGLLGSDILLIDRSDYGPFRARKVPFLFFSTGENPLYHSPRDVAETLNYPKLEAISRVMYRVAREAASSENVPVWNATAENPLGEAVAIRDVLRTLLEHRADLKINGIQSQIMTNTLKSLDGILERGVCTPNERLGYIRAARIILISLF